MISKVESGNNGDDKEFLQHEVTAGLKLSLSQEEIKIQEDKLEAMEREFVATDEKALNDARESLDLHNSGELNNNSKVSVDDFIERSEDVLQEQVSIIEDDNETPEYQKVELPKRVHKPRFFERLQKFAKPIILSLGMSITAGAGAQAAEQRGVSKSEPTNNVEQRIDSEAQKNKEKNIDFLKKAFQSISGGAMGKLENDNLVVFTGDNYYELDSSALNSLMEIAQRHRIGLEGTSKSDKVIHLKKVGVSKMFIKGKIMEFGKKVDISKLPKNLKDFEDNRANTVKEMSEGQIIQPY